MNKLQRRIQKKQEKLKDILQEIDFYGYEGQADRKAYFLATASANRSHSKNSARRQKPEDLIKANK